MVDRRQATGWLSFLFNADLLVFNKYYAFLLIKKKTEIQRQERNQNGLVNDYMGVAWKNGIQDQVSQYKKGKDKRVH